MYCYVIDSVCTDILIIDQFKIYSYAGYYNYYYNNNNNKSSNNNNNNSIVQNQKNNNNNNKEILQRQAANTSTQIQKLKTIIKIK